MKSSDLTWGNSTEKTLIPFNKLVFQEEILTKFGLLMSNFWTFQFSMKTEYPRPVATLHHTKWRVPALAVRIDELGPCHESATADRRIAANPRRTAPAFAEKTTGDGGRHQWRLYLWSTATTTSNCGMTWLPIWYDNEPFHRIDRSPLVHRSARRLCSGYIHITSGRAQRQTSFIDYASRRSRDI